MTGIDIRPTAEAVVSHVADWLADRIAAHTGTFRLCLSGGTTPKALFALLARPERAARIAWDRVHLFWGDERHVPYGSGDSNFGEAKRLLLDQVPVPLANVHPIPTAGQPDDDAARYETLLKAEYGADRLDPGRPLFDVNFLGLGEDGHTASLLPGQPVLQERERWVAAVGEGRPEVRLTMTYPVLESARAVAFLVVGEGKAAILRTLREQGAEVPAARLSPVGETLWFVDRAAAAA